MVLARLDRLLGTFIAALDQRVGSGNYVLALSSDHGVATYPDDARDVTELVEMADSALYRATREGRNRICAYRDLQPEEIHKTFPSREE